MIRQFYNNPQTFSDEITEDYAFPDKTVVEKWKKKKADQNWTYTEAIKKNPRVLIYLAGSYVTMKLMFDAFGPQGEAMKMIVNKNQSWIRYYRNRLIPFLFISWLVWDIRTNALDLSNPYSRGELK